ncbi:hypothetical protein [uncultured Chitinophaga sp.]|uniref:hypothetical protein n=1 Tax=uncultured Chitinophaga sp. TaxID=339340 RepID=UPI0025D3609A|nr:hypothetical protein [uncultured Chitinophaga sp.]
MKHCLSAFVLAALMISCQKNPPPQPPATPATTYIAGAFPNGDFTTRACYWKDSVLVPMDPALPAPEQSYLATGIAQIGTTIYTCGYRTHTQTGENKIVFWANGKEFPIDEHGLPVYPGIPNDLFAVGNTLYMVGELQIAGQPAKPFFWTNKNTWEIDDVLSSKNASSATSGCVADNKLYISGYSAGEDDLALPCYWVAGVRTMLPMPTGVLTATASGIVVVNGVVHICGTGTNDIGRNVPLYWKDGKLSSLNIPGSAPQGLANSIDVLEGDVYIAGAEAGSGTDVIACFWKNGQLNKLSKIEGGFGSKATAIRVTKGLVYVAGNADLRTAFYPVIWKNGVMSKPQLPASPGYTGIYGVATKMILSK